MKSFAAPLTGAFAALVLATSPLAHAATGNLSEQDTHFAKQATAGGMAEVKLGKMAAEKAAAPDVKQFGQRMVADHSQANDQLKSIARKQDINLPSGLDSMHKNLEKRLKKMKGQNFDRAYIQSQLQDHQTQIALFEQEANQGQNPQIKAFATQTLPILQQHYQMAQQVEQSMGAASASSTGEQAGTAAGSMGSISGATQAAPGAAIGGATSSSAASGGAATGGSQ